MVSKFFTVLCVCAAVASAIPVVPLAKVYAEHPEAPAHYEFQYSVHDSHTGDNKEQKEARQGDNVQGSYSLVQPDGVTRIVEYTADKEHGFNAIVHYEGHPAPAPAKIAYAPVTKVAYAPVAKVAYAPVTKVAYTPVAKVAYAPVAKVAYAPVANVAYAPVAKVAAPVAKYAYTENLGHVSFSTPVFSYHH